MNDQPHDICPQLTTDSKTKPSNFDHLFNFIKFPLVLM